VSRFVFTAALICAAPAFADTAYFSSIEDLPLPAGFVERPGWSMATDQGALIEARAEGPGVVADVRVFYEESLPALGWSLSPQVDGNLVFVRARDRLIFAFAAPSADQVSIRVRLLTDPVPTNAD
jgi:hypothetical protein